MKQTLTKKISPFNKEARLLYWEPLFMFSMLVAFTSGFAVLFKEHDGNFELFLIVSVILALVSGFLSASCYIQYSITKYIEKSSPNQNSIKHNTIRQLVSAHLIIVVMYQSVPFLIFPYVNGTMVYGLLTMSVGLVVAFAITLMFFRHRAIADASLGSQKDIHALR